MEASRKHSWWFEPEVDVLLTSEAVYLVDVCITSDPDGTCKPFHDQVGVVHVFSNDQDGWREWWIFQCQFRKQEAQFREFHIEFTVLGVADNMFRLLALGNRNRSLVAGPVTFIAQWGSSGCHRADTIP